MCWTAASLPAYAGKRMCHISCARMERCVATLAASFLLFLTSYEACCEPPVPPAARFTNRFEFAEPQTGVPFRIVLYAPDPVCAKSAALAAFGHLDQLN